MIIHKQDSTYEYNISILKGAKMNKKMLIILVVVLILFACLAIAVGQKNTYSIDNQEVVASESELVVDAASSAVEDEKIEEEFELIPTIDATSKVADTGQVYLYFYQPECSHCLAIKPNIVDFYSKLDGSSEFYRIDMTLEQNADMWADTEAVTGTVIDEIGSIDITGTPTLVTVNDGEITDVAIGDTPINQIIM